MRRRNGSARSRPERAGGTATPVLDAAALSCCSLFPRVGSINALGGTPPTLMKFDDQFIDRVRNSTNIVDVISHYLRLHKSGKDHAALCPFHQEKTPSFMVSESKQIFKCFGCGAGGDAFKFIMQIENLSFPEAIRFLAERNGIPLPQSKKEDEDPKADRRNRLLEIMKEVCGFFCGSLRDPSQGRAAMSYLQSRGIDEETAERFGLGHSPAGTALVKFLERREIAHTEALACGLLKEDESGSVYSKFRNRVMFPIRDAGGRTIAFGGRVLGEGGPKYLNSPETPLYNKGSHLFGLDVAKTEIRRRDLAVLVEGYFDCIIPHQHGINNVVASLGTSLTKDQVRLLRRYTGNVIVSYDPDTAGSAAALRSIELFLEEGFHVNIVHLPEGHDPDSLIRQRGVKTYLDCLKHSRSSLEFALDQFMQSKKDPFSPKGKQEIVSQIVPYLSRIPNRIERSEYVSRVAHRLKMDEGLLLWEIRKSFRRRVGTGKVPVSFSMTQLSAVERTLLAAVTDQEFAETLLPGLERELFLGLPSQRVFEAALELWDREGRIDVHRLRTLLEESDDLHLLDEAMLGSSRIPVSRENIEGSLRALRQKHYRRKSLELQQELERVEKEGLSQDRIGELLLQKEELRRKMELDFG